MIAQFVPISDPSNGGVLLGHTDWRSTVSALITQWASINRPYSSGEVAACVREHRPDLRFSVLTVGETLREEFYAGTLPGYDDGTGTGTFVQPVQIPRFTEGLYPDRTPAGVQVFVYAQDADDATNHPFEVFIPKPGETQADAPATAPTQTSMAAEDPTGKTPTPVMIFGAKIALDPNSVTVSVHKDGSKDGRVCITRTVFEAAVSLSGKPIRGGDPVWVTQDPSTLMIHLEDPNDPKAVVYSLVTDRGRIRVTSQDGNRPFLAGEVFKVKIDAGLITVNIG